MSRNVAVHRIVFGLVLTAFMILFVHSEIDLFHEHSKECEKTDICLIVGAGKVDTIQKAARAFHFFQDIAALPIVHEVSVIRKVIDNDRAAIHSSGHIEKSLYLSHGSLLI